MRVRRSGLGGGWRGLRGVVVSREGGGVEKVRGRYVVGADGSRSSVRRLCRIGFEGETLPVQLVATDVEYPFTEHGFMDANFMLDPAHYGLIAKIMDEGSWRVSYGFPGSLSFEEIERALPGPRPLRYRVRRIAPYKARQRCAGAFRERRMLLAGDAVHSGLLALLYPRALAIKG